MTEAPPPTRRSIKTDWVDPLNMAQIVIPLSNGTIASVDKKVFVVGGFSVNHSQSINQVLEYDMAVRAWNLGPVFPSQVSEAVAMSARGSIFVFGGWDDSKLLNTLHKLTPTDEKPQWHLVTSAQSPSPRRGHAMATDGKSFLYLFGGFDGSRRLRDLWRFDIDKQLWALLDISGIAPTPRDNATLAVDVTRNRLILFFDVAGAFTA